MRNLSITVTVIPHNQQRYDTVGDWLFTNNGLEIYVSKLGNMKWEALVALHEQHEALLCFFRGIKEEAVTIFDEEYEKNRKDDDENEPGDCIKAPYFKEHQFATSLEHFMAHELGVDWSEYEKAIAALVYSPIPIQ